MTRFESCWPHSSQPFHDLTGTIPSFHHFVPEAVNGGMVSVNGPAGSIFSILQGTASN